MMTITILITDFTVMRWTAHVTCGIVARENHPLRPPASGGQHAVLVVSHANPNLAVIMDRCARGGGRHGGVPCACPLKTRNPTIRGGMVGEIADF